MRIFFLLYASFLSFFPLGAALGKAAIFSHGPLRVSVCGRFLEHKNGTPFFYLGDTAWLLFMFLDKYKVERYLTSRAGQGYTVIMASLWAFRDQNAYGDPVFDDNSRLKPNAAYFDHAEWVVDKAAALGLYVAINPAWGNSGLGGKSGEFNVTSAKRYGEYLGTRFKNKPNVIWFLGGDDSGYREVNEAFLAGIRASGDKHLVSWHPEGGRTSLDIYSNSDTLLDFNMYQSGHGARDIAPSLAREAWAAAPPKPLLNGEPNYEDHPINWNSANGYFDDFDVRKQAYWNVFSGACGHVYGHHAVWQFFEGQAVHWFTGPPKDNMHWDAALTRSGATQMVHLRKLIESRPFKGRIPDQNLVRAGNGSGGSLVTATRDSNGSYAMVYIPRSRHTIEIDMEKIEGPEVTVWWYNPRNGTATNAGTVAAKSPRQFTTPQDGPDWVLVLDCSGRGYGTPGHITDIVPTLQADMSHRTFAHSSGPVVLRYVGGLGYAASNSFSWYSLMGQQLKNLQEKTYGRQENLTVRRRLKSIAGN